MAKAFLKKHLSMSNVNQAKFLQIACQTYSWVCSSSSVVSSLAISNSLNQLEKIQCIAAHFVMNNYTHCRSVTNNLSWPTLAQRRNQIKLIPFFKIVHGLVEGTTLTVTPLSTITFRHHCCYVLPCAQGTKMSQLHK